MLLVEDRKFAAASMKDASHKAFVKFADERVRLYREGSLPLIGNESATKALADKANVVTWEPAAGQVSRSGDLGYTYGTYQATDPATSQVREKGNYLRIWKRQNGRWRVVIDVANPVAE
jgi:ketosteroid isomerase-like protein